MTMSHVFYYTPAFAAIALLVLLANQRSVPEWAPLWVWLGKTAVFMIAVLLIAPYATPNS